MVLYYEGVYMDHDKGDKRYIGNCLYTNPNLNVQYYTDQIVVDELDADGNKQYNKDGEKIHTTCHFEPKGDGKIPPEKLQYIHVHDHDGERWEGPTKAEREANMKIEIEEADKGIEIDKENEMER